MLRALALCVSLAAADAPTVLAASDEPAVLTAAIAAQPLAQALEAFARQTGLHVVYVSDLVQHQISRDVPAGLGAEEALARLLQGTGLKFEFLTARSVHILADEGPPKQPPAAAEETRPTIIVTGSRIPVPANISATSPLVVVTAEDIVLAGHTDTGDVISALPQMISSTADDGNNVNNWGISTADLRGLGPQRTVVLVNGKRLGLGDPNTGNPFPAPDLDQIPLPMIERVEVLTGGASATYGSDAVAGVVNFILKDHVQGVQIDAQLGFAEHTQQNTYIQSAEAAVGTAPPRGTTIDGARRDLSLLAGTGFANGAGQLTSYFVYHNQDPVYGSNRDFSSCTAFSLNNETRVPTQGGVDCSGTLNSNIFAPNTPNGNN